MYVPTRAINPYVWQTWAGPKKTFMSTGEGPSFTLKNLSSHEDLSYVLCPTPGCQRLARFSISKGRGEGSPTCLYGFLTFFNLWQCEFGVLVPRENKWGDLSPPTDKEHGTKYISLNIGYKKFCHPPIEVKKSFAKIFAKSWDLFWHAYLLFLDSLYTK